MKTIWHDKKELPTNYSTILIDYDDRDYDVLEYINGRLVDNDHDCFAFNEVCKRWAYIKDIEKL